jgi:chromate reductase, NAD(P)H dehydrogenase (quinone)
MKTITILLASQGHNHELAQKVSAQLTSDNVTVNLVDLVALDLPLYSTIAHEQDGVPDQISTLVQQCQDAGGFVVVAPEYNGGVPPVLTNAIAWVSVSTKEWRGCFNAKPAGIATFSGSGGMQLLVTLRMQLSYLGLTLVGLPLHTNHAKPLVQDDLEAFSKQLVRLI